MSACQDLSGSETEVLRVCWSYLGVDGKPHPAVAAGAMAAGSPAPPKKPNRLHLAARLGGRSRWRHLAAKVALFLGQTTPRHLYFRQLTTAVNFYSPFFCVVATPFPLIQSSVLLFRVKFVQETQSFSQAKRFSSDWFQFPCQGNIVHQQTGLAHHQLKPRLKL